MFETPPLPSVAAASLSMILVAKNAELFFEQLIDRWLRVLDGLGREVEVVFVDDDSADATKELAAKIASQRPAFVAMESEEPHGIGAALRTGLATAKPHPLVGFAEFAPDYDPEDLKNLLEVMDQVDLVSGSRLQRASRFSGRRLLERWVFGVRFADPACPFKLFRSKVFERIPLQSRGDFVHTEIIAKANFLGSLMTEVPVVCHRPGKPAPDPFWKQDMKTVFYSPDFGPPPSPPVLESAAVATTALEDTLAASPPPPDDVL